MHLQEVSSTFCHFDEMAPPVAEMSLVYALDTSHLKGTGRECIFLLRRPNSVQFESLTCQFEERGA